VPWRPAVVYKVDRLTRSLADFAKLVELFDHYGVSFVSIMNAPEPAKLLAIWAVDTLSR
jgi:DNA invertase Pin-like site-specific DNA recombinase